MQLSSALWFLDKSNTQPILSDASVDYYYIFHLLVFYFIDRWQGKKWYEKY